MKETPSQLNIPSYVMNFPFTLSTSDPNNAWMDDLNSEEIIINRDKAYKQFMDVYNFIACSSLVYILPSEGDFQDQVYVANLGLKLHHIKDRNVMLLSNYSSKPRQGEEWVGKHFYNMMGYETFICPHKWEGEADLKYVKDNIYIGGYGQRSTLEAYEWMEQNFGMKIIKVKMNDKYLYHLDCSIFPLDSQNILIYKTLYTQEELNEISKYTNLIDVPESIHFYDTTNCVRVGNKVLGSSFITELDKDHEWYAGEVEKIEFMTDICSKLGLEYVTFNMSEFAKSGAALSCCVQHLNSVSQDKILM